MQNVEESIESPGFNSKQEQTSQERHFQIINDFAMSLLQKTTIDEIVWLIAKSVIAKMGFVDCVVYLLDDSGKLLNQRAAHGIKNPAPKKILNPIVLKIGEGIVGTVAQTGIPEIIHDTRKDDRYIIDDASRLSEIAVPIIYENKILGVIDAEHPDAHAFSKKDLTILNTIAAMSSIKIVHAQTLQNLRIHKTDLESQIKDRIQQLNKTIVNLERSNQDLESFAYAASHDMQEPLRTIISYLQLLRRKETSLSETSLEFLDFAVDGSKRMKDLLDGLLQYSLVNNTVVPYQALDLNDILTLVKASLHRSILENKTHIEYPQLPVVYGDKTQILRVFQNLLSNAIKFQKPNQAARIDISFKELDNFYEITLADNGIGIAAEYQDKVFGLFKRLNSNQDYKGSGIGLALCRRIIEQHGGTITLASAEGEGSAFTFMLPKVE